MSLCPWTVKELIYSGMSDRIRRDALKWKPFLTDFMDINECFVRYYHLIMKMLSGFLCVGN